jgi:hypothetical protein
MSWHETLEMLSDLKGVLVPLLFAIILIVAPLAAIGVWGSHSGCKRVCEANGDDNGWDWWMGCFCQDEEGLYNPKDSRETQRREP